MKRGCSYVLLALALLPAAAIGQARFSAGKPPREDGLRFVRISPIDGDAREIDRAGRACLQTNWGAGSGYLYFDLSRALLTRSGTPPYRVEVTVEFLDEGTDRIALQYDAMGSSVEQNFREVAWSKTGTGRWLKKRLLLSDCEFRNSQQGRADLRIGSGPDGDECIASLEIKILDASKQAVARPVPPAPKLPALREVVVRADGAALVPASTLSGPEQIASARLEERIRQVGSDAAPRSGTTLVIGRWDPGLAARYPRTATAIARLKASPAPFHQRDGYVVCVEGQADHDVVCAVGLQEPGAVYAMAHLQANALRSGDRATLALDSEPLVETPALDRRELYLNIGYGLRRPGITVEDWTADDWRRYVDQLVASRYNAWSFYLWGDSALLDDAAIGNRELNQKVHRALLEAIDYSHKRGLKVGFHLSPTLLPAETWTAHPELQSKLEYNCPGALCPSQPETMRLSRIAYGREIRYFKTCDFYSTWFYDAGGCMCDRCRTPDQQLATLVDQVRMVEELTRDANPAAEVQVMTWALWRYEKMHGFRIRERLVEQVKGLFNQRPRSLSLADGLSIDDGCLPLFDLMRKAALPSSGFLYQTNIETGQPFPLILSRYFSRWVPEAVSQGARGAFLMRIEAGSKPADDAVAGQFLWKPWIEPSRAMLTVARLFAADTNSARSLWEAFARMDDFAWFGYPGGGADAASGRRISELVADALRQMPGALVPGMDWLRGAGDGYRLLGAAAEAADNEDEDQLKRLDAEFSKAMGANRLFAGQATGAPYWQSLFLKTLARSFSAGWSQARF